MFHSVVSNPECFHTLLLRWFAVMIAQLVSFALVRRRQQKSPIYRRQLELELEIELEHEPEPELDQVRATSPPPTSCISLSPSPLLSPPPSVLGLRSGGGIKGLSPLELMEHHTCAFTHTHRRERRVLQLEMGAFGDLGWGY